MKVKIAGLILALFVIAGAASAQTYVLKTDTTIMIDGNLSEWANTSILTWKSPHSDVDVNYIYLLHSNDYYYIGAKIYDNDGINDDSIRLYLNNSTTIIRFDLSEGSNSVDAFKYENGSWSPLSTNVSVVYTKSSPYSVIEMEIPKSEFNYSNTLLLYLEYRSTHIRDVYGWYPVNAMFNDSSTWEKINFIEMINRTLNLSISDRDGVPADYAEDLLLEFRYTSNTTEILTVFGEPQMDILLPPAEITMVVKYLDLPVFEKNYDLTLSNVTDSVSINNLLKVDCIEGYLVISVEKNGTLKSVDFDRSKGRAVIVANSSEVLLDSKTYWRFIAVLYADSYVYNPITNHLSVNLNNSKDVGFVLVVGDNDTPVLSYASNVITCFNFEGGEFRFGVKNGTYKFYYLKTPFSVSFNDRALKKGTDYSSEGNVTTVNTTSEGLLEVHYEKPVSVKLESQFSNFRVYIATPYEFSGKVRYIVRIHNQSVEDRTITFKANPPLSVVNVTPSTAGDVEIHIYDTDTDVELFSATQQAVADWTMVALTVGAVLAIIVVVFIATAKKGKEKAVAKMEKDWRFFRRLR